MQSKSRKTQRIEAKKQISQGLKDWEEEKAIQAEQKLKAERKARHKEWLKRQRYREMLKEQRKEVQAEKAKRRAMLSEQKRLRLEANRAWKKKKKQEWAEEKRKKHEEEKVLWEAWVKQVEEQERELAAHYEAVIEQKNESGTKGKQQTVPKEDHDHFLKKKLSKQEIKEFLGLSAQKKMSAFLARFNSITQ